jgi:hypothetical protein
LARAFLVKAFYDLPDTRMLISLLHSDSTLRRLVGFEHRSEIPHESTFSRAFARFAKMDLLNGVHEDHVKRAFGSEIIFHVSRDATAVPARESGPRRSVKKKKEGPREKPGPRKGVPHKPKVQSRQEKQFDQCWQESVAELPTKCDIGVKKSSKGLIDYWRGYKLHVDVADGGVPVSGMHYIGKPSRLPSRHSPYENDRLEGGPRVLPTDGHGIPGQTDHRSCRGVGTESDRS